MEVMLRPGTAACTGIVLHSWRPAGDGTAAILLHRTSQGQGLRLEVVFHCTDPATGRLQPDCPGMRRVGGTLHASASQQDCLYLRILIDASCLEIFTGQ